MVVDQFDIVRVAVTPGEADAPLVVDTDTVLPRALGGQLFQTVTGRYAQISERIGRIDRDELAKHHSLEQHGKAPERLATKKTCRATVSERTNPLDINAPRYHAPFTVTNVAQRNTARVSPWEQTPAGVIRNLQRPRARRIRSAVGGFAPEPFARRD